MTETQQSLRPVWTKALEAHAENDLGYPVMAFEEWYQHGLECHRWNLPRPLVKQAFRKLVQRHKWSDDVRMWQIRAFIYGCRGGYDEGNVCRAPCYIWPLPSDPSWDLVVIVYRDGHPVLDWLHPVSCRFWSEDNEPFSLPASTAGQLCRGWFVEMGFSVLDEMSSAKVSIAESPKARHLTLVDGRSTL